MTDTPSERRRFSRIAFTTKVELRERNESCLVTLRDISLNGLLVERPSDWIFSEKPTLEAHIFLSEEDEIRMKVHLTHERDGLLGYQCSSIDIDSISHLRRLVELNLGDAAAAERELAELLDDATPPA